MPRRSRALVVVGVTVVLSGATAVAIGGIPGPWRNDAGPDPAPGTATVVRVVDGDTLVVDLGRQEEQVRLLGVDTPESVAPDRPVECYGPEASNRLGTLTPPGTVVRLERDVEPRDQYNRLLAYVYRADDGVLVNHVLVRDGYAATLFFPPNTALRPELAQAERNARARQAGLWGACGGPDVEIAAPSG